MYPLNKMEVTSPFGKRIAPLVGASTFHSGIDLKAKENTNCYAVADGVVKIVQNYPSGIGKYIVVEHDGFCTTYGHLNDYSMVKVGDEVKEGELICLSGNTGNSTGAHLHFEVRLGKYTSKYWTKVDGEYYTNAVDPMKFLEELNKKPQKEDIELVKKERDEWKAKYEKLYSSLTEILKG